MFSHMKKCHTIHCKYYIMHNRYIEYYIINYTNYDNAIYNSILFKYSNLYYILNITICIQEFYELYIIY